MYDALPLHSAEPKPLKSSGLGRPLPKRLVADAKHLAKLLGVGLRTVRTWNSAGKLPTPIRIGGRVVWRMKEIRAWLAAGAPDRETWAAMCEARK